MELTRRRAIALFSAVVLKPTMSLAQTAAGAATPDLPLTAGPFVGTRESLAKYEVPAWFGEAKFGIWAHWGPQSGAEQGDWYARQMYIQGQRQYQSHLEVFGHPSKTGYRSGRRTNPTFARIGGT